MRQRPIDRFMTKVQFNPTGCWPWQAGLAHGYGIFSAGRQRSKRAHRWIYQYLFGPIEPSLYVCHRCDNPRCVRPSHLFVGTAEDNNRDAMAKGRKISGDAHYARQKPHLLARGDRNGARAKPASRARGTAHGLAKLTEPLVIEIRRLHAGGVTNVILAAQFSVSKSAIQGVTSRSTWTHIGKHAKDYTT